MSEVGERLRTLQRQIGRAASSNATSDVVRSDLRRLLDLRRRATRKLAAPAGTEIAEGLQLIEWRRPYEASRTVELPWGDASEVERERLVCFDTETTGLAGGVGTRAFMIGSAQWRCGELVVRQLYLTALGGEEEMLRCFSACLPANAIFVSYNGRSYDAPLLKGRYRLHRQEHPFAERGHVDLLYPVRRAYRGVWENCRLQTIERQLLGILREDDLPGREAPAAWLAYLRGQSSTNLGRVLDHNRQDVVTLAILFDRLAAAIRPPRP
ncbi:MAG TPA: ribonuclease H-like domain-containing protein [Rudaea sp.]|jgi:hypothetical protein|nr:ribonuclease H-like domain-containing protein [Rudaea sp.]